MATSEYVCSLSSELQKKAKKELNEKAKCRDRDIQALREKVLAHKGVKGRTDDAFLLRFLRARKFDYDRAYQLLINYYTIREVYREELKEMVPSGMPQLLESGVSIVFPNKDKEGRTILCIRPGQWNPEVFPMFDMLRNHILNLELVIRDEDVQVNGVVVIIDFAGTNISLVKHFDRNYIKAATSFMQEAFPMRLKAINMVNESAIFSYIWVLIKPFLKQKTQDRLKLHGSERKALHNSFGVENLPENLGGTLPHADELAKQWREKLENNEAMFESMKQYSIELPRDIIKQKNDEKVEEMVGTYKKLSVD